LAILLLVSPISGLQGQGELTAYEVTTFAGGPLGYVGAGSANGTGTAARFSDPTGLAVDPAGNIFVADYSSNTIRRISPLGVVTTLAGTPGTDGSDDGTGSAARFDSPRGVAVDANGNVYVTDSYNNTIRKITPAGVVSTLAGKPGYLEFGSADGTGSAARFNNPTGIAINADGILFVTDTNNGTIRRITPEGVVTTLAGAPFPASSGSNDGVGAAARFAQPEGICIDHLGNLYVADTVNHTIRKITPEAVVSTIAGKPMFQGSADGAGIDARFDHPTAITTDSAGNLCVTDRENFTIRKVTPDGVVTTLAGRPYFHGTTDGTGTDARFDRSFGIAADSHGNLFIADTINQVIRRMSGNGEVTTVAGSLPSYSFADGLGLSARFRYPWGVALDVEGNLLVSDHFNYLIRKISPDGMVTTLAGLPGRPTWSTVDGTGPDASFRAAAGVAVDSSGNAYVTDRYDAVVRKITPQGVVTTIAGSADQRAYVDGVGSAARFEGPTGIAVDTNGNIYVADTLISKIRKITPAGVVTTFAGAPLFYPRGLAVDGAGNVYVGDMTTIRKYAPDGAMALIAGQAGSSGYWDRVGPDARFNQVWGLALDSQGNLFVADRENHLIRMVTQDGTVSTIAGGGWHGVQGNYGNVDGIGSAVRFYLPTSVAVDESGVLYVADYGNGTIRVGIRVPLPPVIIAAPVAQVAGRGRSAIFSVSVNAIGPLTYQWRKNGVAIAGATEATYTITNVSDGDAGAYSVVVANSAGSTTSSAGVLTVTDPPRLINMSARAFAGSGDATLVMGFHIAGTGEKTLLVRGIGPKLSEYNVPSVVADPSLAVYHDKTLIDSNDDWDSSLAQDFATAGAFALDPGSKDAAFKVTLPPGGYTVHLVNNGPVAEGLIEVYDLSKDAGSRLVNLSCRLNINAGQKVILGVGLINAPVPVVVRNVGPRLADFEVSGTLPDPHVRVYSGSNEAGVNDDWNASLAPRFDEVGAFSLVPDSKDAALQISLTPGLSSIHATGIGPGGVALVELYESP